MPIVSNFTWTGDPSASNLEAVRYLVGDVDSDAPLVDDNAILWEITQWPNLYSAAASVADSIAALLGRTQGMRADGVTYGDAAKEYRERAASLRARGATAGNGSSGATAGGVYAGGISISDKQAREADTDRVPPSFTRQTGAPASPLIGITVSEELTGE